MEHSFLKEMIEEVRFRWSKVPLNSYFGGYEVKGPVLALRLR